MATKVARNPRRVTDVSPAVITDPLDTAAAVAAANPVRVSPAAVDRVTSPALATLESVWVAIRRRHKDLPAVAFTIGGSADSRGHFHAETWADAADGAYTRHEVFISGERLKDGPEGVLSTLLHEATHALAYARGLKDTSRGGRFHNAKFRDLARELGLDAVTATKSLGYSDTTLAAGTADLYRVSLDRLATIKGHRRALTRGEATGRVSNNNGLTLVCPTCSRKIRLSITSADLGPIVCWPCYDDTDDLDASTFGPAE